MEKHVTAKRVFLGIHHHRPGKTRHTIRDGRGARDFPPFVSLEIVHYPSTKGYYLFHIAASGEIADTWHESIEDAIAQAQFEFGVLGNEWIDVEPAQSLSPKSK